MRIVSGRDRHRHVKPAALADWARTAGAQYRVALWRLFDVVKHLHHELKKLEAARITQQRLTQQARQLLRHYDCDLDGAG